MEPSPVTVTFPAVPEYLRLARIATADAASRAGLDYEEIDDVRIAVSELCSLVSVDPAATVTLAFQVGDRSLAVEGESRTGRAEITPNELSEAIVAAVADEHSLVTDDGVTRFRVVKNSRSATPGTV
jgi:serine/threonine-protein kinase RsbW